MTYVTKSKVQVNLSEGLIRIANFCEDFLAGRIFGYTLDCLTLRALGSEYR